MKKLTIFNVCVRMTSQEQCDRMKQICIDYGLPYWNLDYAFKYIKKANTRPSINTFEYVDTEFFVGYFHSEKKTKTEVTEEKFIEMVKEYNSEKYSLDEYKKQLEIESKNFGGI